MPARCFNFCLGRVVFGVFDVNYTVIMKINAFVIELLNRKN